MTTEERPFAFHKREPGPPLSRLVQSFWTARGQISYRRERIAPTGSTVAIFVLGPPILQTPDNGCGDAFEVDRGALIGPHDRPLVNEPTGETDAVGIVATPVGCEALFGVRPSRIRGRVIDLEAAWPAATALRAGLLAGAHPDQMLRLLEETFADKRAPEGRAFRRCERAVAILEAEPTRPIADIAAEFGVSHAHFDRAFGRIVGFSPRSLARLLRMRRLLSLVDVKKPINWADMAAQFGWFDQPHFIRDFKRHTGVTPSRYVAAQKANFTEDEAADVAGFTPEA